jgi:DNA-binding XRE family transcriptional regulator
VRLAGRIFKHGKHWAIEVPILGVVTQGRTRKEAFEMIADAITSLANDRKLVVDVHPGTGDAFTVGAKNSAALAAFLVRRVREKEGLSLADAAKRLGASSRNAYARYERGTSVPSLKKFAELIKAVTGKDFVLSEA